MSTSDIPKPAVLILGARSDIARALAHAYAQDGHPLSLAARNPDDLEPDRADLAIRYGVTVTLHAYDACDLDRPSQLFAELAEPPGIVVQAVGMLGDQERAETEPGHAAELVASNFTGPAIALEVAARALAARGGGVLIGIGSVAGDRGRAKNHWYGGAKAGLATVLSGLRQRWWRKGVHVLTVKPGFVATRMTEGLDLPPLLTDSPSGLAASIKRAAEKRRAVYVPWKWRLIMTIICTLPDAVFKRLRF